MEGISPKLKIMYLMKIFYERTDAEHSITMAEIISALGAYGIKAERKSVYSDIDLLKLYGLDIRGEQKDKTFSYRLESREFELGELKLLVDSVQSARFITGRKSNELIHKLEALASKYEASHLQNQVFVTERVKSANEQILTNIEAIHNAIEENSEIKFRYFTWNVKKEQEFRHGGAFYVMSPWALTQADENYYLVCFDEKMQTLKYFRVDKMNYIMMTGKPRKGRDVFGRSDIAAYAKKRFNMYDGDERTVKLSCLNTMAGVIIDRFGKDVMLHPDGSDRFTVNVNVAYSRQFVSWILSMNDGIRIVGPEDIVADVRAYIKELSQSYAENK